MKARLTEERRETILRSLRGLYSREFDEDLSPYRAERILEFFLKALGPAVYNQAIGDARAFMFEKLEDLDVDFREVEEAE